MNKEAYIQRISSYVDDGFIEIPANARTDIVYDGTDISLLRRKVDVARTLLVALRDSNTFIHLPEGVLNNIVQYVEAARNDATLLNIPNQQAESAFQSVNNHVDNVISQTVPYTGLAELMNIEKIRNDADLILSETVKRNNEATKKDKAHREQIKKLENQANKILRGVSSGVLSRELGVLSNYWWNWTLMALSLLLSISSVYLLIHKTNHLTDYLIQAFSQNDLDYRIFIAKASLSLPYAFLASVGILELRNRIKLRDMYVFRKSVANSLDGYTESLLSRVEAMEPGQEKREAKKMVIEFMITSMLELTKTPSVKPERQSMGVKIRDIGEANFTNEWI